MKILLYVLCQHGLLGKSVDFKALVEHFNHENSEVKVIVLKASASMAKTLDGIEAGGKRCYNEIMELIWSEQIPKGSTVSVLGHSQGGLYLRFALREIHKHYNTIWEEYELKRKYSIFIATPHTGVHCSSWYIRNSVRYLFKHVSTSARDLILASSILLEISDYDGVDSLNAFERNVFYGNQARDNLVSASSALILSREVPNSTNSPQKNRQEMMTITEYLENHDDENCETYGVIDPKCANPIKAKIVMLLNQGLKRVSRFLVNSPSALPSVLEQFDNSAHTRIICHGLMDKSRVGMPMIEHLQRILGGAENFECGSSVK